MDDSSIFQVVETEGKSEVIDDRQNVIISSRDHNNAQHYAQLLNQAYKRGYKKGFREASQTA